MRLNRQGVQRIVTGLLEDGIVEFIPNPNHRRSHLVVLTKRGKSAFDDAQRLQAPWVDGLPKGLSMKEIATARRVVAALRERLEREIGDGSEEHG